MEPILQDIENKEIEIAGGSVVGIVLGTVNSLIKYIANLTLNKKKYENVQEKIKEILEKAEELKRNSINAVDEDKEILIEILESYKTRKENSEQYSQVCKKATNFCMRVVNNAKDTLDLVNEISQVGNRMLASDFKICKYYAVASVYSAIENVYINVESVDDTEYKREIKKRCREILNDTKKELSI